MSVPLAPTNAGTWNGFLVTSHHGTTRTRHWKVTTAQQTTATTRTPFICSKKAREDKRHKIYSIKATIIMGLFRKSKKNKGGKSVSSQDEATEIIPEEQRRPARIQTQPSRRLLSPAERARSARAELAKSQTENKPIVLQAPTASSNWLTRTKFFQDMCDSAFNLIDADGSGEVDEKELYSGLLLIHLKLGTYAGPAACRVS